MTDDEINARAVTWHIANMRRFNLVQRREYLENVGRREGEASEARLREAFAADWEARRNVRAKRLAATEDR